MEFDVAVIGCGPAGLTTALYAGRYGLKVAIFESLPSQLSTVPLIENYPGFEGSGYELLEKMKEQAFKYSEHIFENVIKINKKDESFEIVTDNSKYLAKAVVFSTGGTHRKLGVPGEKEFLGRGVSYCATCDGHFFRGKKVIVVGGGNTAVTDAIYLKEIGCDVTLVHRRDELRADKILQDELFKRNIPVLWNTVVVKIEGNQKVEKAILYNKVKDEEFEIHTDGIFIAVGIKPMTEIATELGVEVDERGYIKVDRVQRTNINGVFAAGDCCDNPLKQVVTACGDGALAAYSAFEYLKIKK